MVGLELRFDEARAVRVVNFFERALVHTKGRYARAKFVLAPWQRDEIIRPLFGTIRFDEQLDAWVRAYTLAWIELARKNGKSEIVAGCGLYLLTSDGEEGAEVYGCAKDRDQAGVVYRVAKRMVELSPVLSREKWRGKPRLEIIDSQKRIIDRKTDSFYQVIAADGAGNLGWNPHGVLFDEVITQPSRELWDALKTGMGTRDQPMMLAATTAGNDPNSMAADEHSHSERVQRDPSIDPARFVFMRNTPKDADWRVEKNWHHANPALGDFLRVQVLRDEAKEAAASPAKQNAFRQFRLNQWVQQTTRFLDLAKWDASAGVVRESRLVGRTCCGGLDLASSVDIAALCWDFPNIEDGSHDAIWRFWVPEDRIEDLDRRTGGKASVWVRAKLLVATPGDVIDYKAILAKIDEDAQRFDVVDIAYDRWGMTQMSQDLQEAGMEVIPFGQGYSSMSPPTKEWERLILKGQYHHGRNPVMRWMVDNVVIRRDPAGNIKIDKQKSSEKVDGCVAGVMALSRGIEWLASRQKKKHAAASF